MRRAEQENISRSEESQCPPQQKGQELGPGRHLLHKKPREALGLAGKSRLAGGRGVSADGELGSESGRKKAELAFLMQGRPEQDLKSHMGHCGH